MSTAGAWDFWIDRGGTFTDVVGKDPDGRCMPTRCCPRTRRPIATRRCRASATSSACQGGAHPRGPHRGGQDGDHTVATQRPARAQGRSHAAADHPRFPRRAEDRLSGPQGHLCQNILKPEQLYERVVEIDERVRADGTVECALDLVGVELALREAMTDGFDAVAIVYMHAWRWPEHEKRSAALPARSVSARFRSATRSRRS